MRLGQLARKLSLRPGEVVDFLSAKDIPTDEGVNTRLAEAQIDMVIDHFAPGQRHLITPPTVAAAPSTVPPATAEVPAEMAEPPAPAEVVPPALPADVAPEEPAVITETVAPAAVPEETVEGITDGPPSEITMLAAPPEIPDDELTETSFHDVIKAPKVALPGLKVVGKIELPTPKKKEPDAEAAAAEGPLAGEATEGAMPPAPEAPPRRPRRDDRRQRKQGGRKKDTRSKRNPVAMQREREAREAEKRKRAEAKQQKEQRTIHYLSKIKPATATRRHFIDEPVTDAPQPPTPRRQKQQPTSVWGKFVKWLRRE